MHCFCAKPISICFNSIIRPPSFPHFCTIQIDQLIRSINDQKISMICSRPDHLHHDLNAPKDPSRNKSKHRQDTKQSNFSKNKINWTMDIALSIVQQSLNCQTSIISRFHLIINNPFILHFCNIIIRALNSSLLYGIFGQLSSIPHNKLYKTTAFSILDPAIKTHMHKTCIYLQIHNNIHYQFVNIFYRFLIFRLNL